MYRLHDSISLLRSWRILLIASTINMRLLLSCLRQNEFLTENEFYCPIPSNILMKFRLRLNSTRRAMR